jgi:hypothetical protein
MNHKQRREAKYRALGMAYKAEGARLSLNNRSKRSRGKMRKRIGWFPKTVSRFATIKHCGNLDYPS